MSTNDSKHLWHGRFEDGPSKELMDFTASISFDQRFGREDVRASKAHVNGLGRVGVLGSDDVEAILSALEVVDAELKDNSATFVASDEDIHTFIERRVTEFAGESGAKIHTARSRNDQCATAFRLWTKSALVEVGEALLHLQEVLVGRANADTETSLPGYTHLQRAQPVLLAHHLAAHAWAFQRDFDRLVSCLERVDVSPLGACALAGSSLDLDPVGVAEELGFAATFDNSLDATSDNDFVAEALFVISLIGVHLSRLGEEIVLWSSEEFGFMELHDAFSTGSSMMPQKKNPDIAELARGKAGRLIGNLAGLLATLKGVPLAYNRDLQEAKEPLFDSVDQINFGLLAVAGLLETAKFNTDVMETAGNSESLIATDLAEFLVSKGVAFRNAHAIVGSLVREALAGDKSLAELTHEHNELGPQAAKLFEPGAAAGNRVSLGGAGSNAVDAQLTKLKGKLKSNRQVLETA